jgi:type I restriction enzyme S subunit
MEAVGEYGGLELDRTRLIAEVSTGYTYFRDGDVLVAKITPCFENGKGGIAEGLTNGIGFGTTELHVIRPCDELDKRFLFYLTISHPFRDMGAGWMYGAGGQKRVPDEFVRNFRTPFPAFDEQRAIAAFLDLETARIDGLIAKKERQIELLQEKRAALISHAVTKGLDPKAPMKPSGIEWLGDVPAHWEVIQLRRITLSRCDGPFGSGLKSEHYTDEGIRVIRLQNIRFAEFDNADQAFIDPDHYRALGDHNVEPGDLLIAGLGDENHPVGRACVAPDHLGTAMVKADCFRYRLCRKKADPTYFGYLLSTSAADLKGAYASGTTRSRMNLNDTADRAVLLPPLNEQEAIAGFLVGEVKHHDRLRAKIEQSIGLLQEYRTALISAGVTGKIDVRTK